MKLPDSIAEGMLKLIPESIIIYDGSTEV